MASGSRGVGQYVASEVHGGLWGRGLVSGVRALFYVWELADRLWLTAVADVRARHQLLAEYWPMFACDLGQPGGQKVYGEDLASQTRLPQLKTFVQGASSPFAAASGKVNLLANSKGALTALNYARANPTHVNAIYFTAGLFDVQDVHDNNRGGLAAEIETAYGGGAGYTAAMPAHNPAASGNQTAVAAIAMRSAYSTDDPICTPTATLAYQTALVAAGGSMSLYSMGAVGHAAPARSGSTGLDPQDIVDFFAAHP